MLTSQLVQPTVCQLESDIVKGDICLHGFFIVVPQDTFLSFAEDLVELHQTDLSKLHS